MIRRKDVARLARGLGARAGNLFRQIIDLPARAAAGCKAAIAWTRQGGPIRIPGYVRDRAVEWLVLFWKYFYAILKGIFDMPFGQVLKAVAAIIILGDIAVYLASNIPATQIPRHEPVDNIVYLDQGWGRDALSAQRQTFYYSPQGTSLRGLRYSWFVHLEQAWSSRRFSDPENMRALGFLVEPTPTKNNPYLLPIGFARHFDTQVGDDVLDFTCAACHTGELDITSKNHGRVGILIDGGPAMHAFTAMKLGHFGPNLLASMAAHLLNPFKWSRFAHSVLGDGHDTIRARIALLWNFSQVFGAISWDGANELGRHLYPVEEGFGRTDAIGRIANRVFAEDLGEPANYRPSSAPVSYPALWDIWKFDWVQYTASVSQPMARNLGESLGVGVSLDLTDVYGRPWPEQERFAASARIKNLKEIEDNLHLLKQPEWPEEYLGNIDRPKADAGQKLFQQHCAHCHEPCLMGPEDRALLVPGKTPNEPEWRLNQIPVDEIGTDPASALHFNNTRVDLTRTGLTAEDVRNLMRPALQERQRRENDYAKQTNRKPRDFSADDIRLLESVNIKRVSIGAGLSWIGNLVKDKAYSLHAIPKDQQGAYDGFGALDLPETNMVYKARPLGGVWATAPYLHNGSVPTLYEMLIPADQRRKKFFVGRREFDRVRVGLYSQPLSQTGFWLDTSIPGNLNIGHEFRAGYVPWTPCGPPSHGVIGPELTEDERWKIVEYLKIHRDDEKNLKQCEPPPPPCPGGAKQ